MAKVVYSANIQDIRGKLGNTVHSRARNGSTLRTRVSPKQPKTAGQTAVRSALTKSSVLYKNMTAPQLAAWATYAQTLAKHDPLSGKTYAPAPGTVFGGLTDKFLQMTPAAAVPMTTPTAGFAGDSIGVSAVGVSGKVTFTASAANTVGVKTELLLQPLKSRARTPTAKAYRTKTFFAFVAGTLVQDVIVPAGFYAPAYRFVNAATGQMVGMITLPVVQVL